jgi:probable phosphoglycerate mutase
MLFVIRHGETDRYIQKISQGWANNPLNTNGIVQAEKLAEVLREYQIEYFYSSDLLRAEQTAKIINEKLKMQIKFDGRLREYNSGDIEGKDKSKLAIEIINDFQANPNKYNAESHADVYKRASSFISELRENTIDNALLVTHGCFFKMLKYCSAENSFDIVKFKEFYETSLRLAHGIVAELDIYESQKLSSGANPILV